MERQRFSKGDTVPADWFEITPNGTREFVEGDPGIFMCDVEVEVVDGVRHVYAMEEAPTLISIDGYKGAEFLATPELRLHAFSH